MPWRGSHSFLNDYILRNHCRRIMEIGVLDGENAVSMVNLATRNSPPEKVEYYGFDLFEGSTFHEVTEKLAKTGCTFRLFKGDSVETLPSAVKTLPRMDLIFIDGGKSYSEAKSDWENSRKLMHDETAVFVHNLNFPGVKRTVDSISRSEYRVEIIHAPSEPETALIKKKA